MFFSFPFFFPFFFTRRLRPLGPLNSLALSFLSLSFLSLSHFSLFSSLFELNLYAMILERCVCAVLF